MTTEKTIDVSDLGLQIEPALKQFLHSSEDGSKYVIVINPQKQLLVSLQRGVMFTIEVPLTKKQLENFPIGAKLILNNELKVMESIYVPVDLAKESTTPVKRGYNGPRSQAF